MKDEKSFVFSLDKKEKYKVTKIKLLQYLVQITLFNLEAVVLEFVIIVQLLIQIILMMEKIIMIFQTILV